jgi:hypothetical protein
MAKDIQSILYSRIVEGPRRGPPEDVGGPWGYGEFLEAIADPKHERHIELPEWCGGDFDPKKFDIDAINRRLTSLAPRKSIRRKPPNRPLVELADGSSPDGYGEVAGEAGEPTGRPRPDDEARL